MGAEVFHSLKKVLHDKGLNTAVGDEGGFAPNIAVGRRGARRSSPRPSRRPATSSASRSSSPSTPPCTELFEEAKQKGKTGYCFFKSDPNKIISSDEMIDLWKELCAKWPIRSIEDGLAEDDWDGWKKLTAELGGKVQLVGDDLFVTNTEAAASAASTKGCGNSILVKVNQIGTLTETLDAIELAMRNGFTAIISHRSGETEDATIADIAVATNCGPDQDRLGQPHRPHRQVQPAAADRGTARLGRRLWGRDATIAGGPRWERLAGRLTFHCHDASLPTLRTTRSTSFLVAAAIVSGSRCWLNRRERRQLSRVSSRRCVVVGARDRVCHRPCSFESPREEAVRRVQAMVKAADARDPRGVRRPPRRQGRVPRGAGSRSRVTREQLRKSQILGRAAVSSTSTSPRGTSRAHDVQEIDDDTVEIGFLAKGEGEGKQLPMYFRATFARQADGQMKLTRLPHSTR